MCNIILKFLRFYAGVLVILTFNRTDDLPSDSVFMKPYLGQIGIMQL
jgi:hypothetical protein